MLFKTLSAIASLLPAALLFPSTAVTAVPIMGPVTIYTPAADYTNERSLYARAIQLEYQKSVSFGVKLHVCGADRVSSLVRVTARSLPHGKTTLPRTKVSFTFPSTRGKWSYTLYLPPPLIVHPLPFSQNNGKTWSEYSRAVDQVNGVGLKYQPDLYELPRDIGSFKKGTILLAGNSIPRDLQTTQIDLYASTDKG